MLKQTIKKALICSKLKYNYFSSDHPKESFRGKLFKFLSGNNIQFLKDLNTVTISPSDLNRNGKKLYFPADMS